MVLYNEKNTHKARDEAGSFDEGAADVAEVPDSGARQLTAGHTEQVSQTLSGHHWATFNNDLSAYKCAGFFRCQIEWRILYRKSCCLIIGNICTETWQLPKKRKTDV